jgi:hypothetical protein
MCGPLSESVAHYEVNLALMLGLDDPRLISSMLRSVVLVSLLEGLRATSDAGRLPPPAPEVSVVMENGEADGRRETDGARFIHGGDVGSRGLPCARRRRRRRGKGERAVDLGDGARGGIDPTTTSNAASAGLLAPRQPLVLLDPTAPHQHV